MALRKLPEAFGLTASKSWYPHFYNTRTNLDYIGPIPGIEHYGVDQMSESERKEFMTWYDTQKDIVFDKRHVLKQYVKMTSQYYVRRARYFVEISWRSETLTCF